MKHYTRKTVAGLLGVDDRSVSQYADEANTAVKRSEVGPKARQYSFENVFDIAKYLRKKRIAGKLPMRVLTTNIPRGGTGKTFLASNLAVAFSLMGIKTVIIDVDYQASATLLFGYEPDLDTKSAAAQKKEGVDYHLGHLIGLRSPVKSFEEVVKHPYGVNGPTLIPSDVSLTSLDNELFLERLERPDSDLTFKRWLQKQPELQEYELVIFDSGPGFNRVISAALAASHIVLAPIGMERVSHKGLSILSNELDRLRGCGLGVIASMRIVANLMVNTQRSVTEFQNVISKYHDLVIPYTIKRSEEVPKSYSDGLDDSDKEKLMPFMLAYPSSDLSESLKSITSVIFNELWGEGTK